MPSSPASDYDPSNDSMVWLSKRGEEAHDASGSDESDDEVPRRTRSDSENEAHKVAYEWKQKTLMERLDFGEQVDSHGNAETRTLLTYFVRLQTCQNIQALIALRLPSAVSQSPCHGLR